MTAKRKAPRRPIIDADLADAGYSRINVKDDEELQWYVAQGHDLVSKSPLGAQLECMANNFSDDALPNTVPTWLLDFSRTSVVHKARRTAVALWGATGVYPLAAAALWAYCHPTTVASCDGMYGNVGRLLALYPMTRTGQRAVDAEGRELVSKRGLRPYDALRRMNAERCQAKGEVRKLWVQMRQEALVVRTAAFDAYADARVAVKSFVEFYHLMPSRAELAEVIRRERERRAAEANRIREVKAT